MPDLTIVLDEQCAADQPASAVRDAFLARRDAVVRGYVVLPPSTDHGLEPAVLKHANAAVVSRRDLIMAAAPATAAALEAPPQTGGASPVRRTGDSPEAPQQ